MNDITFNDDQSEALAKVANYCASPTGKFSLCGLAGTGKTTLIPKIIEICREHRLEPALAAPTGKAASVLNRKLGRNITTTIHSLAYRPIGKKKAERKDHLGREINEPVFEEASYAANIAIIDESSMVSGKVFAHLLQFAPCIFIGDHGQLPPVKAEGISPALADANHTLKQIVRQAEGSPIIRLAHEVRSGAPLSSFVPGIRHETTPGAKRIAQYVFENEIEMVICATNKVRDAVNVELRRLHGYSDGEIFSEGELVLTLTNRYSGNAVFNGEIFKVVKRHRHQDHEEGQVVYADLAECGNEDRVVKNVPLGYRWRSDMAFEEGIVAADSGYCLTAHKAQGSQAQSVAVIAENIGWMNDGGPAWRYTAVTRAAEELHILKPWS